DRCCHSQTADLEAGTLENRHPETPLAVVRNDGHTVGGQTASFSSLAARKATFLLALIWISSPVAGLRPLRAARLRTWRMPRPTMRIRSPFFRCLVIMATMSLRIDSACFFDNS